MLILGINAFHGDSSACIVRAGQLLAAAEEERFTRVKHWAGFPAQAVGYCLKEAGARISDLDIVALNHDGTANLARKLAFAATKRPDLGFLLDRLRNRQKRAGIVEHLESAFPGERFRGKVEHVEHHLAHLSSAFHVSPFETATVVSVDGFGDFASAAWGIGQGSEISIEDRVFFPHSLGAFYQALTQFLGFPNYGDEYKVMGLAAYGRPQYLDAMRRIVRLHDTGSFSLDLRYFVHHAENFQNEWEGGEPRVGRIFSDAIEELLGPPRKPSDPLEQRHRDIAHSVQAMYEEAFFSMLNARYRNDGLDRIAIAGGCGMNSVANGKISLRTPFKNVYIQSAAGDAGGAIGAAYAAWHRNGGARRETHEHAYWGPSYSDDEIGAVIAAQADLVASSGCMVEILSDEAALCKRVARHIADGAVVGWFQGRMEWGPRALGNRSIVCDPRRADMKDILNLKIKRRESFRPFAPSVLREHVGAWFEQDSDVPFMMQVYQIRPERRAAIPAVTHVDGSGRLQTVSRHANPRYHSLISAFHAISGVPMVLNTSFNENEPVVCTPAEALACFLRTRMDLLVMGNWLLSRGSISARNQELRTFAGASA